MKDIPYWWDTAPELPNLAIHALPSKADVVVVGSGYTGLAAARETAVAGLSTLVLDAGDIGGAASARNGGQVSFSIKPSHVALARKHGTSVATRGPVRYWWPKHPEAAKYGFAKRAGPICTGNSVAVPARA